MVFFYLLIVPPPPPHPRSLHCCSHSPLLIQFLYLFFAFVADGIADVVPEGGVELGVITLSSLGTFASVKPNRQHTNQPRRFYKKNRQNGPYHAYTE